GRDRRRSRSASGLCFWTIGAMSRATSMSDVSASQCMAFSYAVRRRGPSPTASMAPRWTYGCEVKNLDFTTEGMRAQLTNSSRAERGVDVRVRRVGQTIGVVQPGPHVERVTIRILLEPERLVEQRRRRLASLDRAEVLAAHELQVPIALGLVIEN